MAAALPESLAPHRRLYAWTPGLRGKAVAIWLAPVLAVAFLSTMYLATTGETVTLGSTVQHLRAERDTQREVNRQLEFELAKLQSLAWVENEAIIRLGMQRAAPLVFLSVTRPVPASARALPSSLARKPSSPNVGERVSIWGAPAEASSSFNSAAQP